MFHQVTDMGQNRGWSPTLLEVIGLMSPYNLWWQNQKAWGRDKTAPCPATVQCQLPHGHQPQGNHR